MEEKDLASRYRIREEDCTAYSPANHTGTVNRRLIGPGVTDSRRIEVVRGTIEPGHGAEPHAHPGIEQVCYLLAGRAMASVGGQTFEMQPGDCCYFPEDLTHTFEAIGAEPVEVLVIYSPPSAEADPDRD